MLQKNPNYREVLYDEDPPAGDARLQAIAAKYKGQRLPLLDQVEISIIEEQQPRWLSFLNDEHDVMENLPPEFANIAIPNNKLAPNLQKRGIGMLRYARADVAVSYFGMENPVVGGYTPDKVALRRAIALAVDLDREIRLVRRDQAIPGAVAGRPRHLGLRPGVQVGDERLQPGAGQGAARHVRLRRQGRRRLARSARRLAAGAGVFDLARPELSPAQRAVAEEHGRDRHPHRVQGRRSGPSS